jgi:hypothetical protein
MDPTWESCAFCKAEGVGSELAAGKKATLGENSLSHRGTEPASNSFAQRGAEYDQPAPGFGPLHRGEQAAARAQQGDRKTGLDPIGPDLYTQANSFAGQGIGRSSTSQGAQQPDIKKTSIAAGVGGMAPVAGEKRRIVGILVTYTWKSEGQVFEVREGRNRIGRDPNQCDIAIERDDTLSARNSSIIYRSKFVISDLDSQSGTHVNGEIVEEASVPLPNYSSIRVGSTTFTFVAFDPLKPTE